MAEDGEQRDYKWSVGARSKEILREKIDDIEWEGRIAIICAHTHSVFFKK